MGYHHQETDDLIYQAVYYDDWGRVSKIFEERPELRTKPVNRWVETPLMIAVGTDRSHHFVKNLLSSLYMDLNLIMDAIAAKNDQGDTALHYAAKIGNMIDAKQLLTYWSNPAAEILLDKNNRGVTPLFSATSFERNKEMLKYFCSLGIFLSPTVGSRESNVVGNLLKSAINAGFPDIALKLVENGSIRDLQQALHLLSYQSNLFHSGRKLRLWQRCIYYLLPVHETREVSYDVKTTSQQIAHDEEAIYLSKKICNTAYYKWSSTTAIFIKKIFQYLASPIKKIYGSKRTHQQTKQLVKRICTILKQKGNQGIVCAILVSTIDTAVEFGNYEVIKECILVYPSVIWTQLGDFKMFHQAIKQRQEQVYNLVYQMSSDRALISTEHDENGENILHIAAKLAPSHRLNTTTGAALQLQRELQWFKEIESIVEPSLKIVSNIHRKTPEMVFRDEHKELLIEGKEWMKDTASSSTVVAALIVTVAFAAVFTLPGGDANKGKIAFTIFIISDAIALFSSATSALLFLGILTSRYAQNDFLHVLPRILMSGLFSLFLSLAATLITFSATLALVLQREMPWIAAPLVVITSIPIGIFVLIQLPLLVELFYSTYGPNIFRK